MDANKLKKLQEIGYKVHPCCGLCKHGKFRPNNDFGDCTIQGYKHLKHTAESKPLSVVRLGGCPSFEPDSARMAFIHGFAELMEEG